MAESIKEKLLSALITLFQSQDIIPALSEDSDVDAVDDRYGDILRDQLIGEAGAIADGMLRQPSIERAQEFFEEKLGETFTDVILNETPGYTDTRFLSQEAFKIASCIDDILMEVGFEPGLGIIED